jgi:Domain of unknown function (DUF4337)
MPDEINELKEHAEEGAHEPSLAPVTLTMAVLAVLVAAVTLLGHRAHTEEIILQTRSADQWAYYQAKEIRRRNYELFLDELSVFSLQSSQQVDATKEKYAKEIERYDLSEVLLEAALVISSITLLTRKKLFWYFGIVLALTGIVIGITGWLIH